MFEQVGNEYYGLPLEAVLPLLVENYEVYEIFSQEFGTDRMEELYGVMEAWDLTSELGEAVRSILVQEIVEQSEVHWCGKMTVNRKRVSFRVQCYAGIYVICTEEPLEFGYFLSLEDARTFLKFHWSPVAGVRECDDEWDPEERLEEQATAHAYIDRIRRQRRALG